MVTKTKLSKNKLQISLNKYKEIYQVSKRAADAMDRELNVLSDRLEIKNNEVKESRLKVLELSQIEQTMTLVDADSIILYDGNAAPFNVTYVIDGEEFVIEESAGEFTKIPLKEFKKSLKNKEIEDEGVAKEFDIE